MQRKTAFFNKNFYQCGVMSVVQRVDKVKTFGVAGVVAIKHQMHSNGHWRVQRRRWVALQAIKLQT